MIDAFKRILAFLFLVVAASCIDPYVPKLKSSKSFLVVEGLITNENNSNKVKLTRTISRADSIPEKVTDAYVYITDSVGTKTDLQNLGDGYYKTDSTIFIGVPGQKYTLHIITAEGEEYISDECTMIPVTDIDTIYYVKSEEILGEPGKSYTGLNIMLNTANIGGNSPYFRWTFEEVWKYNIQYPVQFTYTFISDTILYFQSVPDPEVSCWRRNQSSEILINSVFEGGLTRVKDQKIQFIAPLLSNRLTKEYSILVKQYSISAKEYNFWKDLIKVGEPTGDIFSSQPFPTTSNIHNRNDINEMVLGYFGVSAVTQKRIFITSNEIQPLNLPHWISDCNIIRLSPDDWPIQPPTWDQIYYGWVNIRHYIFIMPEVTINGVIPGYVNKRDMVKMVFATNFCSSCEESGFSTKPDFWIDLK